MSAEAKSCLRAGAILIGVSLFPYVLLSGASKFGVSLPQWIEAGAFLFLYFLSFLIGFVGFVTMLFGLALLIISFFRGKPSGVTHD